MKPFPAALALACALAGAGAAHAQPAASPFAPGRFALGLGGGTNGGSLELAYDVNRFLVLRGQGAGIGFDADFTSSDITYRGRFRQVTGGAMADLHPFANPVFVSGGFVSGERKVKVRADADQTVTVRIDGAPVQANQVIGLSGDADLGATAPFAGLGFDNTFTHAGHWGFRAVAGVIFGQDPKVRLHASGPYATDPTVLAQVAEEQASLQSDVDGYRYYPVVQLGVSYRF